MRGAVDIEESCRLSRRAFLRRGTLFLAAGALPCSVLRCSTLRSAEEAVAGEKPALRLGLITDLHYADKNPAGTRYYRDSLAKVREAVRAFREKKVEVAVELGDFIDAANTVDEELRFLATVEKEYEKFKGKRHYVLGNHCVTTLTKKQFLANCAAKKAHYSFDVGDFHFVILDACYRADGVPYGNRNFKWTDTEIPPAERKWLEADLAKTDRPTIVFVHQRLDVANDHGVKSAVAVRGILERSRKVLAVFQGHSHQNDHREIRGIHYCTLRAVVEGEGIENSGYSILEVYKGGVLKVDGFRQQKDYEFRRPS